MPNKPSGSPAPSGPKKIPARKLKKSEDQLWGPAKHIRGYAVKKKRPVSARLASQGTRVFLFSLKNRRPIAAAKPKPVASPARARATHAAVPVAQAMEKTYSGQYKTYNGTVYRIPIVRTRVLPLSKRNVKSGNAKITNKVGKRFTVKSKSQKTEWLSIPKRGNIVTKNLRKV